MAPSPCAPPVSVVVASRGRPAVLGETLESIRRQTLVPGKIVVVVPGSADLPANLAGVETIIGPEGLTRQRNAGIRAIARETPYVAFFDDDFEMRPDYLGRAVDFMERNPSVAGLSGLELGGNRPHTREEARRLIAGRAPASAEDDVFIDRGRHFILYGCNMVIRRELLAREEFDERLPLYGYGEDYEMTMRLLRHGRIGRFHGCIGVHLLATGGRVREVQRGYSQVANNWYFLRKGTVHLPAPQAAIRFWLICVGRNVMVAGWNALKGERSTDWPGRLRGHLLAVRDILTGRSDPGRIVGL